MINLAYKIFTPSQIDILNQIVDNFHIPKTEDGKYVSSLDNNGTGACEELGRVQISDLSSLIPEDIKNLVCDLVSPLSENKLSLKHSMYVEYNNKYGIPNLPPHFDKDDGDLIVNYQLGSNTSWGIGVDVGKYDLEDNSAVIFNGNTNIHWRPYKQFKNKDYVRMIFFRFNNPENPSDYSQLPGHQSNYVFTEVVKMRERSI